MTTLDKIAEAIRLTGCEVSDAGTCLTTFGYEPQAMCCRADMEAVDYTYCAKNIWYTLYAKTGRNHGEFYLSEADYGPLERDIPKDRVIKIKAEVEKNQTHKYEIAANLFEIVVTQIHQNDRASLAN